MPRLRSWNQVTKCSASSAVSRKRGLPRWPSSRRVGGAHNRSSIGGQRSTPRQRGGARVAPAQHCSAFASDQRGVPEFSPRRKAHSASLIGLGENLHGRKLASALMRSRVHNRTRDRGGESIRLMGGGIALGPSRTGRGRSLKSSAPFRFREMMTGSSSRRPLGQAPERLLRQAVCGQCAADHRGDRARLPQSLTNAACERRAVANGLTVRSARCCALSRRDMGTRELVPPRRFIEPCLPSPAERPAARRAKKALARRSVVRCLIFALSGTDELFFIAWKTGE
jgi:hypothetical protein